MPPSNPRILLTGDFIFSSSFDKTAKAWLFDVSELGEGNEERACVRTFKGHSKGVYPMVFIPAPDNLGDEDEVLPTLTLRHCDLWSGGRTKHQAGRHVDHGQRGSHRQKLEVLFPLKTNYFGFETDHSLTH